MSNKIISLDIPAGNGVGAASDTSKTALQKTVIVTGSFVAQVVIEISGNGTDYVRLDSFSGPGTKTYPILAAKMRVRVAGYKSGAPIVALGAAEAPNAQLVVPAVPVKNGTAASIDVSALGPTWTISVSPGFDGVLVIDISDDNTTWIPLATFSAGGYKTIPVTASRARVRRSGATTAGTPVVVIDANPGGPNLETVFDGFRYVTVYARTTGNDLTGDGTLTNPYLTFARCVERVVDEVGNVIPPGVTVTIDITGIGTENLADDFAFPSFSSPMYTSPLFDPVFFFTTGINILATPQLTTAIPAPDATITALEIVGTTPDPVTGLLAIQTTKTWPVGGLKGLFLQGAGISENSVIYDNTADTIYLTTTSAPTAPLRITEPSAGLFSSKTTFTFEGAPSFADLFSISFLGLGLQGAGVFTGMTAINCAPFFELCRMKDVRLAQSIRQATLSACDFEQPSLGFNNEVYNVNSFIHDAAFGVCFGRPGNVQFFSSECVYDNVGTVNVVDSAQGELAMEQNTLIKSCLIRNSGYEFNGGRALLVDVLIEDAPDYAVAARLGHGVLECQNVQQTGATTGAILVNDGCFVKVDVDSFGGVGDDMTVGDLAPRTFVDFRANAPINQQYDLTAVAASGATGTGSRLYQ